jgi:uncharacterized protein
MELESGASRPGCGGGVMKQRERRTRSAGQAMSLDQLDAWFNALNPPAEADGASMLDGYVTALVVGPCSIPPDEWFVDLLGERGRIATAYGKTLAGITAIAARFNATSEGLSTAPTQHAPIFEKTDDGLVLPQPWCMGFLSAMRLRLEAWRPLLDLNRVNHGLMLPILLYCVDALGGPMLGPPPEGAKTAEFLRTAYHDIPLVIPAIREFWMPQRLAETRRQA